VTKRRGRGRRRSAGAAEHWPACRVNQCGGALCQRHTPRTTGDPWRCSDVHCDPCAEEREAEWWAPAPDDDTGTRPIGVHHDGLPTEPTY
jgi:hypothetical protein